MVNTLDIYRDGDIIATIDIDENTVYSEKLPGTDVISCPVNSIGSLQLYEGDYILHKDNKYTLNILPTIEKDSASLGQSYKFDFEAEFYQLLDTYVLDNEVKATFPYYGNAQEQLQLIVNNANRDSSGWSVGTVDDTEDINIDYDWTYVRTALDDIAEKFGLEWKADGKVINMVATVGRDTGLVFKYGPGLGLHNISRSSDTSKSIINRVYGVGGTKNIDASYRGGTETNLVFEERFVETPGVTAGTERVKEGKYENLDIYPHFKGSVTTSVLTYATDGTTVTGAIITDPTIDFNLNDHLQEGVKAKASFLTGPLTGVDFEISNFNFTTKAVTLILNTDANGYTLPSALNFPEVGDKYTFLDVRMPDSYKIAAEAELKAKSITFLNENKFQRLVYDAKPDEKHLRDNLIQLRAGDRVDVVDAELEVNEVLRFTEISYPLVNEYDVTGVVGNEIAFNRITKLFATVLNNTKQVAGINLTNAQEARRNSRNLIELRDLVIDPSGNYYTEKIKPRSVESLYLSIGAVATNFNLTGVSFDPNHLGNPNSFTATAGQLIHYDIKIGGNGFVWEMQSYSTNTLVSANKYFLYARISKTALVGSWALSTEVLLAESEPGFFTLQAGILFPVVDGRRDNQITKGMIFMIGDQITAGRLKSIDNRMFIDLTTGQLMLGDSINGLDWNVTTANKLTIKGALVQSGSGIVYPVPVYRGAYVPGSTYYKGDTVTYNGSSWIFVNDTPTANQSPADNEFWDFVSKKGDQGAAGLNGDSGSSVELQYSVNGSTGWHSVFADGDLFMRQRTGSSDWSSAIRIVGEAGVAGTNGSYTDYQFAKNTSLTVAPTAGFTDQPPSLSAGEYLWTRIGYFQPSGLRNLLANSYGPFEGTAGQYFGFNTPAGWLVPGLQYLAGKTVTLAANGYVYNYTGTPASLLFRYYVDGNEINHTLDFYLTFNDSLTDRKSVTIDIPSEAYDIIIVGLSNFNTVQGFLYKVKLNYGTVSDDWTPAAEDPEYNDYAQVGAWSNPVRISGPQGEPGIKGDTTYTWLKYADDANGAGISDYPDGKKYIGLAYNKPIASESQFPEDYQWALFQAEGVPGVSGADGKTTYTWVKYGDSPTAGMSDSPDGKRYMGLSFNRLTQTESTDYADYQWSLVRGADGTSVRILGTKTDVSELPSSGNTLGDGYTIDGDLYTWTGSAWSNVGRIKGDDGINGQNAYVHIKYSNDGGLTFTDNNGETSGAYIGVYSDFTLQDAIDTTQYQWTKLTGTDGANGVSSLFTEYRYQKNGSTTSPPSLSNTSNDPSGWSVVQPTLGVGEYLWMTSAQKVPVQGSANLLVKSKGTFTGQAGQYFGYDTPSEWNSGNLTALAGKTVTLSANGYVYSYTGGATGILLRYVVDGNIVDHVLSFYLTYGDALQDRKSLTVNIPSSATNILVVGINQGTTVNGFLYDVKLNLGAVIDAWSPAIQDAEYSSLALLYGTWSVPMRVNGKDGDNGIDGQNGTNGTNGQNGAQGPFITYSGNYDPNRTYIGSSVRIEAVKYNGIYYYTRVDAGQFSSVLPTNSAKWNPAGAQFDSVATGLLLAQAATIDNLTVRNVQTSDHPAGSGIRSVDISGADNNINLYIGADKIVSIDDDTTHIYTDYPNGSAKIFGPGIRVNEPSGRYATMSARSLIIYDDSGNITASIGQEPILTQFELYMSGRSRLADIDFSGSLTTGTSPGLSTRVVYKDANGLNSHLVFKNGILIESASGA